MGSILKLLRAALAVLFPKRLFIAIDNRINSTKSVMTNTPVLVIFWKVILFPVNLFFDFTVSLIKTVLIWILPGKTWGHIRYIVKLFIKDKTEQHMSTSLALKRTRLCLELFIKGREKRVSFGDKNPDKTFFVIRPYYYTETNELITTISNLLYHYYRNLQHLSYAVKNDWIPVVDWQNYGPLPHQEDYPVNGTTNGWEYFWNQPSEYTLEEVYQSKNVILSDQNSSSYGYIPPIAIETPLQKYAARLAYNCPQYDSLITLNEPTAQYVAEHQARLFPDNAKILGVSVRGASYGAKDIPGHPRQPTVDKLINSISKAMEEWEMDYIYFACEYEPVVEAVKEAFDGKVIVLPRQRYERQPTKDNDPLYEDGVKYQTNLDYLTEMVLLSRCNSLLAGMSGGVRAAIIWNASHYEHMKIFENGMW